MKSSSSRLRLFAPTIAASLLLTAVAPCGAAPPPNDNLANAQVLPSGNSFSVNGVNADATQEPFELAANYPVVTAHTVWYAWTPTASGDLYAHITRSGGLTSNVAVFKGTAPTPETFLGQDTGSGAVSHVHVDAGQTYRFSIANDSYPGSFAFAGTITAGPTFYTGETALSDNVYYLAFSSGNVFGYFSYLEDSRYIYHFDLGYEYVFDANDGNSGVYLYDFASSTFFYTSPGFGFPYLYDFTLKAVLYYYPNTGSAGHYTTNPRYFYNFATGKIITK